MNQLIKKIAFYNKYRKNLKRIRRKLMKIKKKLTVITNKEISKYNHLETNNYNSFFH